MDIIFLKSWGEKKREGGFFEGGAISLFQLGRAFAETW
ncbi:hypothetical protein BREVNS_1188 [Brevinematales bacterium NS]|nr:hypothetical protein BREVNS_1188 [Brevinematales bacterium NS]